MGRFTRGMGGGAPFLAIRGGGKQQGEVRTPRMRRTALTKSASKCNTSESIVLLTARRSRTGCLSVAERGEGRVSEWAAGKSRQLLSNQAPYLARIVLWGRCEMKLEASDKALESSDSTGKIEK